MLKRVIQVFVCVLLFSFNSFSQNNGIVLEVEYRATRKCSTDSSRFKIIYSVRKDIMRLDIKGATANSSIIYQPSTQKIWVLYHHERLYYSMDQAQMLMLEDTVKSKSEEFQRTFEAMDEASKEQTKMLWPDGNPYIFEEPNFSLVGKKDTLISQLLCDKYFADISNGNKQNMYINNLKTTGIKLEELEVLMQFNEFLGRGVKIISGSLDFSAIYEREQGGIPILFENFYGRDICSYYHVKFIYRKKLNNDEFIIPIAYGKYENPLGVK